MRPLRRVCITGPESTGKTSLAIGLAEWRGTSWVAEASREHAERKGAELDAGDVEPIARVHIAMADDAERRVREAGGGLLVLDTDLVSTAVYARHYYGAVPPAVLDAARARRADLYLLCNVDVPWVPDGVRDRPGDRAGMLEEFQAMLAWLGVQPVLVSGSWAQRWAGATEAVRVLER
jgi:NadR type nicotinamide-nucleotide adenylyltransferase